MGIKYKKIICWLESCYIYAITFSLVVSGLLDYILMVTTTIANSVSTIAIFIALNEIRKFVKKHDQWKWKQNGLLLLHLVLLLSLTILEALNMTIVLKDGKKYIGSVKYFIILTSYNYFNFVTTVFFLFLLWRFS